MLAPCSAGGTCTGSCRTIARWPRQPEFGKQPRKGMRDLRLLFETYLRAGEQADSDRRLFDGRKSASERLRESRANQLIADFCGPRGNIMQTVVAH
jgi:hypothetical protein